MKVKRVSVTPELLSQVLVTGFSVDVKVAQGLPPGAQLVGVGYDSKTGSFWSFDFTHESFAEVPTGEEIPMLDVRFERNAVKVEGMVS